MEKAICLLCGKVGDLKMSRRDKPFFRCDSCGAVIFANKAESMELLEAQAVEDGSPVAKKDDPARAVPEPKSGEIATAISELKAQKIAIAELKKAVEAKAEPKAPAKKKAPPRKERETAASYLFS